MWCSDHRPWHGHHIQGPDLPCYLDMMCDLILLCFPYSNLSQESCYLTYNGQTNNNWGLSWTSSVKFCWFWVKMICSIDPEMTSNIYKCKKTGSVGFLIVDYLGYIKTYSVLLGRSNHIRRLYFLNSCHLRSLNGRRTLKNQLEGDQKCYWSFFEVPIQRSTNVRIENKLYSIPVKNNFPSGRVGGLNWNYS